MANYKKIVDVSYHNGNVNFKSMKNDGIAGVIIRAGYGQGNTDKKFKTYIKDAIAAGLPVGIYWFSYAYTASMAKKEAEYCYKLIKSYKIELPVFFDWEYDSERYAKEHGVKATQSLVTNMTKKFCDYLLARGYEVGYYFNPDYKNRGLINTSALSKYYTWLAYYTTKTQKGYDLWQYTEKGKVDGISGNADINYVLNEDILPEENKYTKKKFVKDLQKVFNLPVTGIPDKKLINRTVTISEKKNPKHKCVKYVQKRLKQKGYDEIGEVDGIAGPKFTKAVKAWKKKAFGTKNPSGNLIAKKKAWKKLTGYIN